MELEHAEGTDESVGPLYACWSRSWRRFTRDLKDRLARFLINAIALEIAVKVRPLKFVNSSNRPSFSSDIMFSYMEVRNDLRQAVADNVGDS